MDKYKLIGLFSENGGGFDIPSFRTIYEVYKYETKKEMEENNVKMKSKQYIGLDGECTKSGNHIKRNLVRTYIKTI